MAYRILDVHRDVPEAWRWMPDLLTRIRNFCVATDPETDPREAEDFVRGAFCVGDLRQRVWLALGDGIVGHLWATVEPYHAQAYRHVLIRQAEIDERINLGEFPTQVFAEVEKWTKGLGLERLLMLTHRNPGAMERAWGFQKYKSVMVKALNRHEVGNGISIVNLKPPM